MDALVDKPANGGRSKPGRPKTLTISPRRVVIPPNPEDKFKVWVLLLLSVFVCIPPLFISLDVPDATRTMEKISLLSSQETWLRQQSGESDAWLVPSWNGRDRVNKPPMVVWLNMLAWTGLDVESADPDTLIHRARLLAAALVLVALGATFWAGMSLGDLRVATLGTLIAGTSLLLIRQGRVASYDTHLLAWTAVASAAGFWAMRPLKKINRVPRRVIGWLIAGVALGFAVLTKGPIALVFVVAPLVAAIFISKHRRLSNSLGFFFALCLGLLIAGPWYLYVLDRIRDAVGSLTHEFAAQRTEFQVPWYYLGLIGLVFPWSMWLVGALFQPWLRARGEQRRQWLIAWCWFVGIFVVLSIPGAKQQRYIVPILPAFGILVAQLWGHHAQLASEGMVDAGVNMLRVPHWVMLILVSVALPVFLIMQPGLVESGTMDQLELADVPWWLAIIVGGVLTGLAVLGMRWHFQWKPSLAALATVVWMLVAGTFVVHRYVRSHHGENPYRAAAEQVATEVNGDLMFYLKMDDNDVEPNEEFLIYTQSVVKPVVPDQVSVLLNEFLETVYIIIRDDPMHRELMAGLGLIHVLDFQDDKDQHRQLYCRYLPDEDVVESTPPVVVPDEPSTPSEPDTTALEAADPAAGQAQVLPSVTVEDSPEPANVNQNHVGQPIPLAPEPVTVPSPGELLRPQGPPKPESKDIERETESEL